MESIESMFDIGPSPFDVRLVAFRIPIRVHWSFWLLMGLLGWEPHRPDLTFIWVMCGFVSVLVHELGHALTSEAFGWPTHIILFFNGGVAISDRTGSFRPWRNMLVALMGPAAGLMLYLIVVAVDFALAINHVVVDERLREAISDLRFINLVWTLLNLLPVLPLDGGHICLSFLQGLRFPLAAQATLLLGALVSGFVAYVLLQSGTPQMFAIFMVLFCVQNVMALFQNPR